jgi:hypothetical protein
MKNFYIVDSLQQDVEFVITEADTDNGTLYNIWRSTGSQWSEDVKGELLVSLEDDGNGFKFKFKPREKKRIDYDEIEWLYVLLNHVRLQSKDVTIYNVCQYV